MYKSVKQLKIGDLIELRQAHPDIIICINKLADELLFDFGQFWIETVHHNQVFFDSDTIKKYE